MTTSKERQQSWETRKAKKLAIWKAFSKTEKAELILSALAYKSSADSCNSVYMGSIVQFQLQLAIAPGGTWIERLAKSSDAQLDKGLEICAFVLDYAERNPRKLCPCCGQVTQ